MASCTNCGARLPHGATSCPQCGVFAGEEEDGRPLPKRSYKALWISLLLLALLGGAMAVWRSREPSTPPDLPVRVVGDRPGGARRAPGAAISEAEAIRILRRHLVTTLHLKTDCVAVLSKGHRRGDYVLRAVDSCNDTRLGEWRVNAITSTVSKTSSR